MDIAAISIAILSIIINGIVVGNIFRSSRTKRSTSNDCVGKCIGYQDLEKKLSETTTKLNETEKNTLILEKNLTEKFIAELQKMEKNMTNKDPNHPVQILMQSLQKTIDDFKEET